MNNAWVEACEFPEFKEWFEQFSQSANYFVAICTLEPTQLWAVRLCIAYAWLNGRKKELG